MTLEFLYLLAIAIACYSLALLSSAAIVRFLPEQTKDTRRFLSIDGVRGFLAFGVFIHHSIVTWFFLQNGKWASPPINFVKQLGATSVAIFFMITALLFWGRVIKVRERMNWSDFFVSRLFRIYPLYLVTLAGLLICVAVKSGWHTNESGAAILKEVGQWLIFRQPDINGFQNTSLIIAAVNWTLQYELWFYVALPLLSFCFLIKRPIWMRIASLALAACLFWASHLTPSVGASFLGGIAAAYWLTDPKRVNALNGTAAAVGGLGCFLVVFFAATRPYNPIAFVLLVMFFLVIASGNSLFGLLHSKAALWLGEISYSIYLVHGLFLWIVLQNLIWPSFRFEKTFLNLALISIGLTPIVVLLSSATFLLIERPFIDIGKQFVRSPRILGVRTEILQPQPEK